MDQQFVSTKLKFGIFFLPLIFVWFIFKPEYPIFTKVISFSWLCFLYTVSYTTPTDGAAGEMGVMGGVLALCFVPFLISLFINKRSLKKALK
ncbi:hypothetical protein [Vibrio hibernica]|uniref:hypothetical protein n=1 Tax=Vibrio hibernica TaxID=2587465 RepID=UPI00188203C1|nr:hypothetical protein [Vibrio hibernica]